MILYYLLFVFEIIGYTWLGGNDVAVEGEWRWAADNSSVDVARFPWGGGYPDNRSETYDCMWWSNYRHYLDTYDCLYEAAFMCEMPEMTRDQHLQLDYCDPFPV